jgi:uncharacterized protein DUF3558
VRSTSSPILAGLAVLALLSTAACANDETSTASGGKVAAAKTTPADDKNKKKPAVDACTLLTKGEIAGIIGANSGGHVGAGVGESICEWDNEDNYHSVTVSLGNADTASGGKLPAEEGVGGGPVEAGPDGIQFTADNTGSFVLADRACYVQVVTDPTSKKDRDIAVRLIRLVRARADGKL